MKVLILAMSMALISTTAMAQGGGDHHGGDGEAFKAKMKQELNVTAEQEQQMREIREQGGSREEARAVLTDQQRTKAMELSKERESKSGQRMDQMQQHLGLSDDQVSEMRTIREQGGSREEIQSVLTEEQRTKLEETRRAHQGAR